MEAPTNSMLLHFGWLLAGVVLAIVFVRFAAARSETAERRILALGLMIAAGVYPALAVIGGADSWLWIELGGLAGFIVIAVLGLYGSPLWLSGGWVLHAAWDSPLHLASGGTAFVPIWYILLCLAFDLVVGAAVYLRFRRRERGSEPDTRGR